MHSSHTGIVYNFIIDAGSSIWPCTIVALMSFVTAFPRRRLFCFRIADRFFLTLFQPRKHIGRHRLRAHIGSVISFRPTYHLRSFRRTHDAREILPTGRYLPAPVRCMGNEWTRILINIIQFEFGTSFLHHSRSPSYDSDILFLLRRELRNGSIYRTSSKGHVTIWSALFPRGAQLIITQL